MTYKIKRPVPPYYIPLSDKIEKQLDNEWNAGRKGKSYEIMYKAWEFEGIHSTEVFAKSLNEARNNFYKLFGDKGYKVVSVKRIDHKRGKGWHGDTPRHHYAALKNKNKGTLTAPIKASKPHSENCTCPDCTGESEYERNEQRKIKAWDDANIQWWGKW